MYVRNALSHSLLLSCVRVCVCVCVRARARSLCGIAVAEHPRAHVACVCAPRTAMSRRAWRTAFHASPGLHAADMVRRVLVDVHAPPPPPPRGHAQHTRSNER
ncbi:hypothetical protein EON67_09120 [archaeon]|nr:MAG: hypothetical protein EON67_09120 [archaeon]